MHIRKLELLGFKSFPDKTTFHFDAGVSGVVGPNGCGKSNVVDAVMWCLGEQSPRALRGRSMEDVIFAGSADRPPMGVAEVYITFEAGESPFPGDWARHSEIQIGRRLYRDGHSEYYLNQQRVRLRDIHDLFLDTGVSNRMYSVIEQGRIGEIVNARPEQRRTLIEEAAGISRYKARKKEAEEKLDDTLQNLTRVTEVADELGKRLKSLERQVEKATKYRRLRTRVRQGEIYLGLARFAALAGDRKVLAEKMRAAATDEENLTRRTATREAEIVAARAALETAEASVGRIRDRLAEVEASRRESESARQYQAREAAELDRRVVGLVASEARATAERAEAQRRLEEALTERAVMEQTLLEQEQHMEAARAQAEAAERALNDRRRRIEDAKTTLMARVTELTRNRTANDALTQRRADLDGRLGQTRQKKEVSGADLSALAEAASAAAELEAEVVARLTDARGALERARKDLDAADKGRAARAAELKRITESLAREERVEHTLRARLDSLSAMQARHDGVEDGVRAALSVKGAIGTLAEQLDVGVEEEAPLAVALGESLEAVLVPDEPTAIAVRQAARGRVSVVVLDGASPVTSGFASRVKGSDAGRAALGVLLGEVGEAPDLAGALAHHRATGQGCVSGCGAFVDRAGVITVGQPQGAGALLLARRREIAGLQTEVTEAVSRVHAREAELAAAQVALDMSSLELEGARGVQEQARIAVSEAELALRDAGRALQDRQREHDRQADQARHIAREEAELLAAIAESAQRAESLAASIKAGEAAISAVEQGLKADQAALPADESQANQGREALAQLRAEVATLRERIVGLRRAETTARAAHATAEQQLKATVDDATTTRARLKALGEDDARLATVLAALAAEQTELRTQLDAERERVKADRQALHDMEGKIKELRARREAAAALRADLEGQIAAIREEINRIREQLEDRYQISVAALLDRLERDGHVVVEVDEAARGPNIPGDDGARWAHIEPVEDLRITEALLEDAAAIERWVALLQTARDQLKALGDVNLVAVEEYVEVASEHQSLVKQRDDLDESVKSIRQTIARLNRTCRERFRETFDRVDAYFRELYPRLVGGGQARLVLTNEEDLLETGVEIYVQPPGKRLQHLSLLSGGETAMTAIALLFSLFREKPSPFCLLDEVDAPLDEGNGARFNGLLKEMAAISQFIVITHNKKTMECVDTLYGVTMPAPGVSTLVTVRLS